MGKADHEADLIVLGGGAAGVSAALTAAELGFSVILLEKQGEIGGSSVLSGGSVTFANTSLQRAQGIEDNEDDLLEDILRIGGNQNDFDVVKSYVVHQRETCEWLVANGVVFAPTIGYSEGSRTQRKHTINPAEALPVLLEKALATGLVSVVYGAHAWALAFDPDSSCVNGVEVDGTEQSVYRARHGVVLATGGFAKSSELLARFSPPYGDVRTISGKGSTGDGLLMAWKLGADLVDTAYIQGNYGQHPDRPGPPVLPIHKGAIAINARGNRFADESMTYKKFADAAIRQPGKLTWQIFDSAIMEREQPQHPSFNFRSRVAAGEILQSDSLDGLAELIGVPADNLQHTLARYNAFAETAEDRDFGRTSIEGGQGALCSIAHAPFYAYPTVCFLLGTYCGVRIDSEMRVLDVFGQEIPGLYAAGEVTGGFHGMGELPGTALGKAFVFGRLAARTALTASES